MMRGMTARLCKGGCLRSTQKRWARESEAHLDTAAMISSSTEQRTPHPAPLPFGRGEGDAAVARCARRSVTTAGKDAFHRVSHSTAELRDAVERVLTTVLGTPYHYAASARRS